MQGNDFVTRSFILKLNLSQCYYSLCLLLSLNIYLSSLIWTEYCVFSCLILYLIEKIKQKGVLYNIKN